MTSAPQTRRKEHARVCRKIVAAVRWSGYLIHHTPNEKQSSARSKGAFIGHLVRMKAEGMHVGYPDLRIDDPTKRAPLGVAIEVKVDGDTLTDEQRSTIAWLNRIGVRACEVRHEAEALDWLRAQGYDIREPPKVLDETPDFDSVAPARPRKQNPTRARAAVAESSRATPAKRRSRRAHME